MPNVEVQLHCPIHDSFRVRQVAGMFDLPIEPDSRENFSAQLPDLTDPWQIGVIVGPSGSGKTSIARAAFGADLYDPQPWPVDKAVIDCLGDLPIKQITRTLTAIGFSSPRAWIKPHAVLSNGEKFRCELARALLGNEQKGQRDKGTEGQSGGAEGQRDRGTKGQSGGAEGQRDRGTKGQSGEAEGQRDKGTEGQSAGGLGAQMSSHFVPWSLCPSVPFLSPSPLVFDEFTSVVDRTVARIGSAALSKAIRSGAIAKRFVAVTCHYDVIRWLQPDWVLDMSGPSLSRTSVSSVEPGPIRLASLAQGRPIRRPPIPLRITRTDRSTWKLFERHHYLTNTLHRSAQCFLATFENRPAAFCAVLPFPHPVRPGWREHRTVCLPDFQGVGIGTALSEFIASLFVATGKPYFSTTSHPAMIAHRLNSPLWKMHRKPRMVSRHAPSSRATTSMSDTCSRGRNTAGFEYIGPAQLNESRCFRVI